MNFLINCCATLGIVATFFAAAFIVAVLGLYVYARGHGYSRDFWHFIRNI